MFRNITYLFTFIQNVGLPFSSSDFPLSTTLSMPSQPLRYSGIGYTCSLEATVESLSGGRGSGCWPPSSQTPLPYQPLTTSALSAFPMHWLSSMGYSASVLTTFHLLFCYFLLCHCEPKNYPFDYLLEV